MRILLNGERRKLPADVDPAMPLLWLLRDVAIGRLADDSPSCRVKRR
jgi:aerobic-type carbon monoxide dehydrogenase small subunit (CoxS/CutS family)